MSEIRFTVPGEPKPKGRGRAVVIGGKPRVITPQETRSEEGAIRWMAQAAMQGRSPLDCAIELQLTAYMPIPASWSKKKQAAAKAGEIFPTGRPDFDNLTKLVCDGMNKIVFRDDSLIVRSSQEKLYGDRPRIEVMVRPVLQTAIIS